MPCLAATRRPKGSQPERNHIPHKTPIRVAMTTNCDALLKAADAAGYGQDVEKAVALLATTESPVPVG